MMRRLMDATKRAALRVGAKMTMIGLSVVGATSGGWYGWSYVNSAPKGPTKQIETGIGQTFNGKPSVEPAVASLSDGQLPADGADSNIRQMQFSQPAESSTRRQFSGNSYLPTSNDPAGGSSTQSPATLSTSPYGSGDSQYSASNSGFGAGRSYGQMSDSAPATMPLDPTATATSPAAPVASEQPPLNPYRAEPSSAPAASGEVPPPAAFPPLSQSPYATATPTANMPPATNGGYGSVPVEPSIPASPVAMPVTVPDISIPANSVPAPSGESIRPYAGSLDPTRRSMPAAAPPVSSPAVGSAAVLGSSAALGTFARGSSGANTLAAPTPGERQFEGPQQPSIALEKISPSEIQVGKPATFALYVRNMGQVAAHNVAITDHVPAGTQLIESRPQPQPSGDGSLVWNLGTMQPGEETQITLQVMPQTEGEIGSTAHVSFSAAATSRSISTRPQLAIDQTAPAKVLIGEPVTVGITITNPGTGPATGVIIEEDVPAGLSHVAGSQLEYDVGVLRPGESKHFDLSLRADRAGIVQNRIQVRGDAGLTAQHLAQIEVVAPQLQVAVEGPKRRFLERQATYVLQIANPGTATARDVDLIAYLPRGMRFVSTDSQGQYDPSQHAVLWSLAELPPSQAGVVKVTTLPVEPGEQKLQIEGRGALNLSAKADQIVLVEQAAELVHTVKDLDEVIEVGSETTYEIRVKNQGTKAATNVRIAALMPPGMAAVSGDGPTRASGDAAQITFAPLERLNPQEEVLYKVQIQSRAAGDQIVRVQLSADDLPTVTREESTRVYEDR
jgi:uncharacterized repeat protein (TIGR01451 family)